MEKQKLQESISGNGSNSYTAYTAYTDGAYSSARNQGGIGVVVLKNNKPILRFSKLWFDVE